VSGSFTTGVVETLPISTAMDWESSGSTAGHEQSACTPSLSGYESDCTQRLPEGIRELCYRSTRRAHSDDGSSREIISAVAEDFRCCLGSGLVGGDHHAKQTASTFLALAPDLPIVHFDHCFRDRKAQAHAAMFTGEV
jgi:hypothetical protein